MSNLGLLAGSSFMHIFISLQICGDIPGGIVGLKPSRATWKNMQIRQGKAQLKSNSSKLEMEMEGSKRGSANLHANFHIGQVSKRNLSGHQLPQQDGKAPHVWGPTVDLFWLLLQGWDEYDKN